jgi:cell division protein ZapA (FtsZ GTPase activity inhibitor)
MDVVEIEIAGRRYALKSDRPAAHVRAVAEYVDERLKEVGGVGASMQRDHAVLAALNIASELFLVRQRAHDLGDGLDHALTELIACAERGIAEMTASPTTGDLG